jgi:hypothetical protein
VSYAAPPGAPTRGAAEGVFQAFETGGSAIRTSGQLAQGVPGVIDVARIYPGVDDAEYCQDGWHVILVAFFDDPAFFAGGNQALFDHLDTVDIWFVLDGVRLETERTAIKRLARPNPAFVEDAFAVNFGAFLPPGSLSVGAHQVQTFIVDPLYGDGDFTTTFTVVDC